MPPALETAATTSRQWVKAKMGNSIPRRRHSSFTAKPPFRPADRPKREPILILRVRWWWRPGIAGSPSGPQGRPPGAGARAASAGSPEHDVVIQSGLVGLFVAVGA